MLCCSGCDVIIKVFNEPQVVSNYGGILQQILLELQSQNKYK